MLTVDFNLFPLRNGDRVLDVGCGAGRHSWYVCKQDHCLLYAMDLDLESLQKNIYMLTRIVEENGTEGKWTVLQGDVQTLPFEDSTFDKIICSEVMEHVIDDEQGVKELVRVLKNGGELAVSVPAWMMETIYWKLSEAYHTNPGGHIRIYKEDQLISLLCRNDLTVYAVRYKHALHSIYWLLRCLFGVRKEKALIPSLYYKFLTWEIDNKSRFFYKLESLLDHLFPKSVVIYLRKENGQKAAD